jgi:general secretion pathway protein A
MYQSFYGLTEMPFHITPDPRFLYLSPSHLEALRHLQYGVDQRKGFIVVVGEVGCGKTTVCRSFLDEIDVDRWDTALILNPRLTENQMLRAILHELGEPESGDDAHDLVLRVHKALLSRIERGRDILLIIDEAQNLSFEVLEQVRLLSNLETDKQKLLQIVLFGQPELKLVLKRPELRQLRQRVLVHCEILPLRRSEIAHYIQYRLSTAGANGRPRFSRAALWWIHRFSGGVPRLINNLCDKALLSAYIRDSDDVTFRDLLRAWRDVRKITD